MMNLRNSSRVLSPLVALTAAFVLGTLGTAPPASAWAPEATAGQPGRVELPRIQVSDVGTTMSDQRLTFHANELPRAFRSPATQAEDAQNVKAVYDLERWDGSRWVTVDHKVYQGQILPSEDAITFPMVWIQPDTSEGSYRAAFTFSWSPSNNPGRTMGEQRAVSSGADDFSCAGIQRACESRPGYVFVGPPAA
ncbi:hypothetical protein [Streptomyces venezuelae]|uniref:hypothetical protein n=1 Tax=Streptomyces venezuelae TaxID=54571 RepID=UPI00278BC161|nr:hypothetical protein [Streptomyces venezuelae]